MFYLLRNYVEFVYLILRKECKADNFVYRFELSKYEYKNDVEILKEMAPNYGIEIIEDNNVIRVNITNKDLYDKMFTLLSSCYYTNRYIFNDNDILIQMLISSKLLNNVYLNIDEFAENIGFSRSNLRTPIKKTRAFLKNYNINTFGKPYYGLCSEGSEFDIRICLSDIYAKITPEILYVGDNNTYIDKFDYLSTHTSFAEFCVQNHLQFSEEDNKVVCYYLSVTKDRLFKGYVMNQFNAEKEMLEKLSENTRLQNIAKDILEYLQLDTNHYEKLALMVVLLNCNVDKQDAEYYVTTLYFEEKIELEKRILSKLKEVYHLHIHDAIYLNALSEEINSIIIKKHTGKLVKIMERFLGRTPNVHSYPLCYFINETLKDTISDYYNLKINRAVTETLADIVYYYIENLEFSFKKYDIVVASCFDRYAPILFREKLKKDLDQKYIRKIDACEYFSDLLNHTDEFIKNYDLIITDTKLQNVEIGISFSDVNNSIVRLETYLRHHRDMCSCLSKGNDIKVIHQNIVINKKGMLEKAIFECGNFENDEIHRSIQHAYQLKGILSLLIPYDGDECILQFGNFSKPLIIDDQKIHSYHIFKGKLSENNIRIINVILHELILDPIFVEVLKENPNKNTLNEQINMIIK